MYSSSLTTCGDISSNTFKWGCQWSTHRLCILHRCHNTDGIIGYVDSNYVGDIDKRSLTSYVFTLSDSTISWKATIQPTIVLSTIEANYMVVAKVVKEVIWL